MKYLKKFNELKSTTYKSAGEALTRRGHKLRGAKILDYSKEVLGKENLESLLKRNSTNKFLNDVDNKLEGYVYLYDTSKKSWINIGLSTAKISGIDLATDNMLDSLEYSDSYLPYISLWIGFQIDLSPFKDTPDIERHYTHGLPISQDYGGYIELGPSYVNEMSYVDDCEVVILLNRKGLRSLNKIVKKYLTDGYGQEITWYGKSVGNFIDSEVYNLPDYLYIFSDYKLSLFMDKNPDDQSAIDYSDNFDDNFRDYMEKIKSPKVYYKYYRDEFPKELKNIGLE